MSDVIKHYQPKNNIVEAAKVTPATVDEIARWCGGVVIAESDPFEPSKAFVGLNVPTVNGMERAGESAYVVRDGHGRFSVVPGTRFEALNELVH